MIGLIVAASGVLWVSVAGSAASAIVGFAVATFGVEMSNQPQLGAFAWTLGGKNSGAISAAMNMAGNLRLREHERVSAASQAVGQPCPHIPCRGAPEYCRAPFAGS